MKSRSFRHSLRVAVLLIAALGPATVAAAPPACVGDCDRSGDVTVDEIVKMVRVALGDAPVADCTAGDADSGGAITVDEVITAVNTALGGCAPPPTTATANTSQTPTPIDTETPTQTPTAAESESETPEPSESETVEPTETETPAPTTTNGMMPLTTTPGITPTAAQTTSPAVAPTDTPAPQPTATAPAAPTLTPVVIPTQTLAPQPTNSPGGSGSASVDVGNASGTAGSTVTVAVTLNGGGDRITATSNDIVFDTNRVNVVQTGGVACTINPAVGQGTEAGKMLLLSVAPVSGSMARLRVGLISFSNSNPVPDGLLFTCQFQIAAGATPGPIVLDNLPEASDGLGNPVSVGGSAGVITVQ